MDIRHCMRRPRPAGWGQFAWHGSAHIVHDLVADGRPRCLCIVVQLQQVWHDEPFDVLVGAKWCNRPIHEMHIHADVTLMLINESHAWQSLGVQFCLV